MSRLFFLAGVLTLGCGDGASIRVMTFNTGLAPGDVPLVEERVAAVAAALAESESDVLCLQEFFRTADLEAVLAAGDYSGVVHHPDADDEPTGCEEGELEPVADCVAAQCPGACGTALLECAVDQCDALDLSSGCVSCALDAAGCVDEVRAQCADGGGVGYLYPAYDTAILSRVPILESESRVLDSTLVHAAADFARLDTEIGELDVYCVHLTSSIGRFEYEGEFGSWEGERAHQLEQVLAFTAERSAGRPFVVAGDLNAALGSAELLRFAEAGFGSVGTRGGESLPCTICPDNTFRDEGTASRRVDHVLISQGLEGSAHRIFADPVTLTVDGSPVQSSLSDHYGIEANVRFD